MKVKDIIKKLEQFADPDYQLVYDMFSEDDIREYAQTIEITLTNAQVRLVVDYLERKADAEQGMSWGTIEFAINQITKE